MGELFCPLMVSPGGACQPCFLGLQGQSPGLTLSPKLRTYTSAESGCPSFPTKSSQTASMLIHGQHCNANTQE